MHWHEEGVERRGVTIRVPRLSSQACDPKPLRTIPLGVPGHGLDVTGGLTNQRQS